MKTRKKVIISGGLFILLLVIIAVAVIVFSSLNASPVQDRTETGIDKIDVTAFSVDKPELSEKQDKKELDTTYPVKTIRAQGKNFQIIGLSQEQGGDSYQLGGCGYVNHFENYILFNNEYYKINMENLGDIFKPQSKEDFIDMVNYFYMIGARGCSGKPLLFDGNKVYEPSIKDDNCKSNNINIGIEYEKSGTIKFSYYFENINYPLELDKVFLTLDNGILSSKIEKVFSCNGGISY